ncbi:hypothetical protein AMECASPLE_033235, partial [Ameca splendens]
ENHYPPPEESKRNHPGATVQKPQGAAATSPQAPPEQIQPWTQRPETPGHIIPQAEARQSPGVQAPASGQHNLIKFFRRDDRVKENPLVHTGRSSLDTQCILCSSGRLCA